MRKYFYNMSTPLWEEYQRLPSWVNRSRVMYLLLEWNATFGNKPFPYDAVNVHHKPERVPCPEQYMLRDHLRKFNAALAEIIPPEGA